MGSEKECPCAILALRYHSFSEICFNYDELLDELEPDEPPEFPLPLPLPLLLPLLDPVVLAPVVIVKVIDKPSQAHHPPLMSCNSFSSKLSISVSDGRF